MVKHLNPEKSEIRDGISVFTSCMNRHSNLEQSLATWIRVPVIDEIIVVDWSSDPSLKSIVDRYQNGKIILARVPDQVKWVLSWSFNLAARLTARKRIFKLDADILLHEGFFERHILEPGVFYAGNSARRRNDNEKYLNGIVYLNREDYFLVNGYNEFLKTYGWDDEDLYRRLLNQGLKRIDIDNDFVSHIPHEARTRHLFHGIDEHPGDDEQKASLELLINKALGEHFYEWSNEYPMAVFAAEIIDQQNVNCTLEPSSIKTVPERIREQGVIIALEGQLRKKGLDAVSDILLSMDKETLIALNHLFSSGNWEGNQALMRTFIQRLNDRVAVFQGSHLSTTSLLRRLPEEESNTVTDRSGPFSMGGLLTMGFGKDDPDSRPLVTVITVVLNGIQYLEETIRSVLNQTYDNVEYIVIDGGSADGTLEIIRKYQDVIDLWISQPDTGIYQAMNKGIRQARGRFVHFLNADDHYTDFRVIERVVNAFRKSSALMVYGDVLMFNKKKGTAWIRRSDVHPLYFMFKGIPQQAFFYKKELFDHFGFFDESLKIVGDLDFYLRLTVKHHIKVKYIRLPVVVFNTGATSANMKQKEIERQPVIRNYYSKTTRLFYKNFLVRKLLTNNDINYNRICFPERLFRKILRVIHREARHR
jgi:glycosyltransferase involved in cell wall biosynthesis